jgi:hypothetical protein
MEAIKIVGFIHLCLMVVNASFFLLPKSKFDYLLLIYQYAAFFSWTVLNGKCAISYLARKPEDKSIDTNDVLLLFGPKLKAYVAVVVKILLGFQLLSLFVVLKRNRVNLWVGLTPLVVYYGLTYLQNSTINRVFSCIFPLYIIYFLWCFCHS